MTTAYTSLLGLALPVTGELSGTWGDVVNQSITSLLDTSVAGTTNVSADSNVTLTTTTGASNQARQAILLFSGARTAIRTVTAPAQSKIYTVINATTGGFAVQLVGAGPTTGVTIANGARTVVAWNGSDFVEVSSPSSIILPGGTANGVAYLNGSKVVTSGSALTFDGTNLAVAGGSIWSTDSAGNARSKFEVFTNGQANNQITLGQGFASPTDNVGYLYNRANAAFVFGVNNTEQMRLTSTGLGIGTSSIISGQSGRGNVTINGSTDAFLVLGTGGTRKGGLYTQGTQLTLVNDTATLTLETSGSTRATIDSSGNLGLGVTPSAWGLFKAIDFQGGGSIASFASSPSIQSVNNAFFDGGNWKYKTSTFASRYIQEAGAHQWFTAASGTAGNSLTFTQAMTLDASGNLGVGTTSPVALNSGGGYATFNNAVGGGSVYQYANSNIGYVVSQTDGLRLDTFTGKILKFGIEGTERARIDSSGNLLVGKTSALVAGNGFYIQPNGATFSTVVNADNALHVYSSTVSAYRFYVTGTGTINATSTTITGISDQRLKENIRDLDDGLDVVMALKPRKFDWKEGKGAGIKNARGFIAQEFETVLPDMIEQWLDPAPEGEEPYKAVNANLIPTLVKSIQEQQAIIESLKARLDAANL